jgi:hypothetical protein
MTLNLTTLNSRTSITNNPPPAAPACGLNETGICCKESETAHNYPPRHRTPVGSELYGQK